MHTKILCNNKTHANRNAQKFCAIVFCFAVNITTHTKKAINKITNQRNHMLINSDQGIVKTDCSGISNELKMVAKSTLGSLNIH